MKAKQWLCALLALAVGGVSSGSAAEAAGLKAAELRCEYLRDPLAIDEPAPRLSWIVSADRRGERQTAYRVLVASTPQRLAKDEGDLWDSGKVASANTSNVPFGGAALPARQECHWKVMSWDRDGNPGPWSAPAKWEMGLLGPGDWTAKWVVAAAVPVEFQIATATYHTADGKVKKDVTEAVKRLVADKGPATIASNANLGGDPAKDVRKVLTVEYVCAGVTMRADVAENTAIVLPAAGIPYLRRTFTPAKEVRKARLYTTALGVYDLSLNGAPVGDQCLAPGWTDYPSRVRYQAFDVTGQLTKGANVLGAVVAPGWFCGHAGLFNAFQFYGKEPALLAQLELTYTDGAVERIVSDESWKLRKGPLLGADLLKGEMYDAAAAIKGWDTAGVSDADWTPATVRAETRTLRCDVGEPVKETGTVPAKAVTEPKPGRWTFDLGQNMVGVVRLRVEAPKGTVITLRHGEMLNPDGTVYTENLRGATSTDTYICAGGGVEIWRPRFTFHGFRYVEVTGLTTKPGVEMVTGAVVGSALPKAGEFSCSDASVNQLQSNISWGLRGNYLSIPTDCPQRDERMGWMADAQVFLPTATYNADVAAFTTAWMEEIKSAQRADGAHSDVSPAMKGLNYGTPAWADAGTIVPWVIYRAYGDTRILERSIDSMIRWVEWCRANSTGLIRDKARGNDYGDWLSIKADTPKDLIGTAYFAHSADLVSRSLHVLGREEESRKYRQLFEEIRAAFNAKYVAPDGKIHGDTQCCYVIPLAFDLLPQEKRADAARRLVEDIKAKNWHLSTGFVGVSHLLKVLTDAGMPEVAHRLLVQDTFPSWLFSVKHGATTIWERWDGWTPETGVHPDPGMNSFNHYSLGSCGQWMFESLAGVAQESDSAGFERIVVRPRVRGPFTSAKGSLMSMRGEISSAWTNENGKLTLKVTIPANTTATVYVPAAKAGDVTESGKPAAKAEGVKFLRQEGDAAVFEVGSGAYEFAAKSGPATP